MPTTVAAMDGRALKRFGLMMVAALFGAAVVVGGLTSVEEPGEAAAVGAGSTLKLQVTGVAGVPSDAVAVALNMTVVNAQAAGFATVYPCGQPRPEASNLNFAAGQTIPNLVIAKPGTGGKVCIYSYAPVDVFADVSGFFPAGSGFTPSRTPPVCLTLVTASGHLSRRWLLVRRWSCRWLVLQGCHRMPLRWC